MVQAKYAPTKLTLGQFEARYIFVSLTFTSDVNVAST